MMLTLARGFRMARPHVRAFSEAPKKSNREIFEEKQREKVTKEADVDEKDETSYQDKHMMARVILFSIGVFGSLIFINNRMQELVRKRKARLAGEPEVLTEKDKINAVGGHWLLKDLDGKDFGSHNLAGNYYLLYFGFSLCPDICPISLMKMTKAIRHIKNSKEG